MKKIKWEPDNFEMEINTVWSFPNRGNWATHDAKYRGKTIIDDRMVKLVIECELS